MQTSAMLLATSQTKAHEPLDLEVFMTVQNRNWSSLLVFFLVLKYKLPPLALAL